MTPLRYVVLGSLKVFAGASEVPLRSRKVRLLLATLLAGRGMAVRVDDLLDALWPTDPPRSARANLRQYLYDLRRALGDPDRIRSADGYELIIGSDSCDADDFESRVGLGSGWLASGDYRAAAREFGEALALWSDNVTSFHGLDSAEIRSERLRLEGVRSQAIAGFCAAERRNGRLASHVAMIGEAARRDPLNEQVCGYLMRALSEAGRREDALAAYQAIKRRMSAELGLSPGPDLADVHREVLNPKHVASRPSPPRPCLLPREPSCFVGRGQELSAILGAILEADSAAPAVAVYGAGGVGKTTLAVRAAHRASPRFPDGQLFVNGRAMEEAALSEHNILDLFLRALGFYEHDIPHDRAVRSAVFRSHLTGRKILIVLDNVSDDIDLASLLPASGSSAVILTSRAPLTSIAVSRQIRLDCPTESEAMEMIRLYADRREISSETTAIAAIAADCGALPLALRIVGAQLALRPHLTVEDLHRRLSDDTSRLAELSIGSMDVSAAIDMSVQALSHAARELFTLLGLIEASTFTVFLAAALIDAPIRRTQRILDELADSQLIDATSAAGRVRYRRHDLVMLFARELAKGLREAQQLGPLQRAIGWMLTDMERAQTALVGRDHMSIHGSAPRWHSDDMTQPATHAALWVEGELATAISIIEQAARLGFDEACWDMAVTLAPLLEVTRSFDEWIHSHQVALSAVRFSRNVRGEGALLTEIGELHLERRECALASAALGEALALFNLCQDLHGTAIATEKLGRLSIIEGDLDEAERQLSAAALIFRKLSMPGGIALVSRCLGQVHLIRGNFSAAQDFLSEAAAHADAAGAWRLGGQIRYRQGILRLARGELSGAETDFRAVLTLFQERPELLGQAYALFGLGQVHARAGQVGRARQLLMQADLITLEIRERSLSAQIKEQLQLLDKLARGSSTSTRVRISS